MISTSDDVLGKVVAIRRAARDFRLDTTGGRIVNYAIAVCSYLRYMGYKGWRGSNSKVRMCWLFRFCFEFAQRCLSLSCKLLVKMLYVRLSNRTELAEFQR